MPHKDTVHMSEQLTTHEIMNICPDYEPSGRFEALAVTISESDGKPRPHKAIDGHKMTYWQDMHHGRGNYYTLEEYVAENNDHIFALHHYAHEMVGVSEVYKPVNEYRLAISAHGIGKINRFRDNEIVAAENDEDERIIAAEALDMLSRKAPQKALELLRHGPLDQLFPLIIGSYAISGVGDYTNAAEQFARTIQGIEQAVAIESPSVHNGDSVAVRQVWDAIDTRPHDGDHNSVYLHVDIEMAIIAAAQAVGIYADLNDQQ